MESTWQRSLMIAATTFGALSLLMLAWLFTTEPASEYKANVAVTFSYPTDDQELVRVVEDLRYRLGSYHGYRWQAAIDEQTDEHVHVELMRHQQQLQLLAQLGDQPVRIEGPIGAAPSLSAKLFELINDYIAAQ